VLPPLRGKRQLLPLDTPHILWRAPWKRRAEDNEEWQSVVVVAWAVLATTMRRNKSFLSPLPAYDRMPFEVLEVFIVRLLGRRKRSGAVRHPYNAVRGAGEGAMFPTQSFFA
jgi:hypothetical protein